VHESRNSEQSAPEFIQSENSGWETIGFPLRFYYDENGDWSQNVSRITFNGESIPFEYLVDIEEPSEGNPDVIFTPLEETGEFPMDGIPDGTNHFIGFNPALFDGPGEYEVVIDSEGFERSTFAIVIPPYSDQDSLEPMTDSYMMVPNDSEFVTENLTLEAWVKPASLDQLAGIISKYHNHTEPSYTLRLSSDGTAVNFQTIDINNLNSNVDVVLNEWVHVASTYDEASQTANLYLNGQLVDGATGFVLAQNNDAVTVGVDFLDLPRYFDGYIDEVRIWDVARTNEQIVSSMNVWLEGNEQNLIGYWQYNDSDNFFKDSSSFLNHGQAGVQPL